MKTNPLQAHVLNPVEVDYEAGMFTATIMAEVTNLENQAVADAIVRYAREKGVTNLYLVDERFAMDALLEKLERDTGTAVDAVPVVHARWVENSMYYRCTACGTDFDDGIVLIHPGVFQLPDYCPDCGAKMDGGDAACG